MFELPKLNTKRNFPKFIIPSRNEKIRGNSTHSQSSITFQNFQFSKWTKGGIISSSHSSSSFGPSFNHGQSNLIWTGNGINQDAPTLVIKRFQSTDKNSNNQINKFGGDNRFQVVHGKGDQIRAPDFSNVRRSTTDGSTSRPLTYFIVGATGVLSAISAKSTVMNFLSSLSASGDVMAMSKVEVDLSVIPEGKSVVIKWRGKPIFIRHRTMEEIENANSVDLVQLRDPQKDSDRVQKAEWIVMLGICTHLGCVPLSDSGDYGGWFCPCQ